MDGTVSKIKVSMLTGSVWKSLIFFAVPLLLGSIFQQLYNTVDSLVVGNFLGDSALAAVSSSANLINLLVDLFIGLFTGAGILVANTYGSGDRDKLSRAVQTTLSVGLAAGILLTVTGNILAPIILRLMNTPADVMTNSLAYFRVYFSGSLAFIMYNCCTGILQNLGDSIHPLKYLILASVTNIVLDILFVGVFHWGVRSTALATILSQGLSATLCLLRLYRSQKIYGFDLHRVRLYRDALSQTLHFGVPSSFQNCMIALSNVVVQSGINLFDTQAIAGCGAWSKLEGFALLPILSFTMALSTFVGQNKGAGNHERIRKGTKFGIVCCAAMSVAIGIILYLCAPMLVALFNRNTEVIAYGTLKAHFSAPFFLLLGVSNCIGGILRGIGKTKTSMFIYLGCWCFVRIILIHVGLAIVKDIRVVLIAYPVTWFLSAVIFLWRYKKDVLVENKK